MFFSYLVSCFLRHHIILSRLCFPLFLSAALLSSSSPPSSISFSLGTLDFLLVNSEAFGSWESLVSIHFFPQCLKAFKFYQASDRVECACVQWIFWVFVHECVLCGFFIAWSSVTYLCPDSLCCRQFVRRHLKTQHNMKSVRRLCKQWARSVGLRSQPEMLHQINSGFYVFIFS